MPLSFLRPDQVETIHAAALGILRTIGVRLPHAELQARFADHGAQVDPAGGLVRIPDTLVASCLASAGKQFTLYGRDRRHTAVFGQGTRNYNSTAGQALWVDDSSRQSRYVTLDDVVTATRYGDALPRITIVGAMADPHEIPVAYRCVEVLATQLRHTTKPVHFFLHDRASARFVIELLSAVAGSQEQAARFPLCYAFLEPISPLKFPFHGIDLLLETARLSLPVSIGPMAQTGASAPGTLAGTIAQEHAEILAGICVTQLVQRGLPVCYGGIPHTFDMRTTQTVFAGPEQALMAVAMTQLGRHCGLPVYINVGLTDSKVVDAQAGIEAGITLALGALAGADIFGHLGICGADQGASLAMLTMQHELIGYVERIMAGITIDDDALGLDVLRAVGHDGSFLGEPHTVSHFRRELWFPELLERDFWQTWLAKGGSDMHARCLAYKERLQEAHRPEPLPDDLDRDLQRIVADAKRHLSAGTQ